MTTKTTNTKTGINQAYIKRLQESSATKTPGLIGDLYDQLTKAGIPKQEVAKLSPLQLEALKGLKGNDLTKAFKNTLGDATGSLTEGKGLISNIAQGKGLPTESSLVQGANTISQSAPIQAQLDAMNTVADTNRQNLSDQVNRQLNEKALPSIYRDAYNSGNLGSSRTAIAEGIARRGASEAVAKGNQAIGQNNAAMQAQLRGNAFNTGLSAAMNTQQASAGRQQEAANNLVGLGMKAGTTQASLNQQDLSNTMKGGALQQAQNQNELNATQQNALNARNKGVGDLNQLQGALSNLRGLTDTQTTQNQSTNAMNHNDYGNILVSAGAGMLANAFGS